MTAQSVYFTGPRQVEVRETAVPDPGPEELKVSATVSAISSGTELLLYRGEMNPEIAADEALESLSGSFSYPFPYGYAVVGTVTAVGADVDPAWHGETVLAFHPHASEFVIGRDEVSVVPDDVSPEAAAFLPNVETAVNLILDGEPRIGERAVVFGQGIVGLLTTTLLAETPLSSLVTVDCYEKRRRLSEAFGADRSLDPDDVDPAAVIEGRTQPTERPESPSGRTGGERRPRRADLTYELSGDPAALDAAVDATGYGGRIVVGSWYGTKTADLALDGRFHRSRIRLISSQVSTIAPARRGRWTVARRLATAWRRLEDVETDRLTTHRTPIADAPEAYALLDDRPDETVQVLLTY